ncbi:MAG: 3-keto-disaccharide hydrolase [Thalassotalea sp.]
MHIRSFISFITLFSSVGIFAADDSLPSPKDTEVWHPIPAVVNTDPIPSDALVLFDGTHFDHWYGHEGKVPWLLDAGAMTIVPGTKGITSKEKFCDMQMHIEWKTPDKLEGFSGQRWGNSGIFIQGRYELQILDSHYNPIYSNGQAGSIYKQAMPMVNASKPPRAWQSYDIIYRSPRFSASGEIQEKAMITVLHNGVLIQYNTVIQGPTRFRGQPAYTKAHGCAPIYLQEHNDKVSYRNIWVRKLVL